jgi:hypothetical protein
MKTAKEVFHWYFNPAKPHIDFALPSTNSRRFSHFETFSDLEFGAPLFSSIEVPTDIVLHIFEQGYKAACREMAEKMKSNF